ncbi:MAG: ABC transporter permease [Candidatus Limnocylindrales bacterium]
MDIISSTVAWFTDPAQWSGPDGIPVRLAEYVVVALGSLGIAIALALPLGLWIGHTGRGARWAVGLANLGRAVPTLAVIAIVAPFTALLDPNLGFTVYPTVIAMVLLAIPPILVNAYVGIHEVDRELVEAARGMGLRERQILDGVELPLALPVVVGGLRAAAVTVLATTTLGAIFGLGGLGRYLVDGIAQQDTGQTWGGVVLVATLVLLSESVFALAQRRLTSPGLRGPGAGSIPLREPTQLAPAGVEAGR